MLNSANKVKAILLVFGPDPSVIEKPEVEKFLCHYERQQRVVGELDARENGLEASVADFTGDENEGNSRKKGLKDILDIVSLIGNKKFLEDFHRYVKRKKDNGFSLLEFESFLKHEILTDKQYSRLVKLRQNKGVS